MQSIEVWPVGVSNGNFKMSESHWERTTDFPNSEIIARHFGFPIGSKHVYKYGLMAEGSHSYTVESIERGILHGPDGPWGLPHYAITLRFSEDLTPNSHWSRIGCKSDETRTVYLKGPADIEGVRCMHLPSAIMHGDKGYELRNQNSALSSDYVNKLMHFQNIPLVEKKFWQMSFEEFLTHFECAVVCGGMGGDISYARNAILEVGNIVRLRLKHDNTSIYVLAKIEAVNDFGETRVKLQEDATTTFHSYKKNAVIFVYSSQIHPLPNNDLYVDYANIMKEAYLQGLPIPFDSFSKRNWAEEALKAGKELPMNILADAPDYSGLHTDWIPRDKSLELTHEYYAIQAKGAKNKKFVHTPKDISRMKEIESLFEESTKAYRAFRAVERSLERCLTVDGTILASYPDLVAKYENYPFQNGQFV